MTTTTLTDSNGNVFNAVTGTLVTPGTGAFSVSINGTNWVDGSGNIIGPVATGCGCGNSKMAQKQIGHLDMIMASVLMLLLIIFLIKKIVG